MTSGTNTSYSLSLRRSLASGMVLNILVNLLLYLGHLIIARHLPRDDYAVFTVVVSFVSLMALFADLGLTLLFVRKFAEAETRAAEGKQDTRGELLGSMLALRFGMAIVVSLVVIIITPALGYDISIRHLMMIMLITLFISSRLLVVRSVGEAFLRGHNRYHLVALFASIDAIVFAAVLFYYSGNILNLEGAIWIYSLCHIPGFILLFGLIYREGKSIGFHLKFSFRTVTSMLREGFPLILSTAFLTIHGQADPLLLDKLSTPKEVSAFGAGLRILSAIIFLPAVFSAVIGPLVTQATVSQDFDKIRSTVERSLRLLLLGALFIAVTLTVSSTSVLSILFGSDKYSDAAPLAIIFGWTFIPICFASFVIDIAIAEGRFWISSLFSSIIMIISLGCDLILIPHYGALGAGAAKCIALTTGNILLIYLSPRLFVITRNKILRMYSDLFFVGLISLAIYYLLSYLMLPSSAILCVVIITFFLSATILIKVVAFSEITSFVYGLFSKLKTDKS